MHAHKLLCCRACPCHAILERLRETNALKVFLKKLRKEGFVFITYILCFYSVLFDFVVFVVIMRKKKDAFELFKA